MTTFDDNFKAGGAGAMLAIHGEAVTYVDKDGAERSITAVVNREPRSGLEAAGDRAQGPLAHVIVKNDSSEGIALSELEERKDRIKYATMKGGTTVESRKITRLLSQAAGMLTLEVR